MDEIVAWLRERHGDEALPVIAQQLGCSMLARDDYAIEHWHAVADRFMSPLPEGRKSRASGSA